MFGRRKLLSGFKVMSFLVLCTALTFNTGCQNTPQRTQSLQKETMRVASTDVDSQEADTPKSDLQKPPEKFNRFYKTLGVIDESMKLNYESRRNTVS